MSTQPGSDIHSRFVVIDGVRMHYLEAGKGRPILLLHGNPTSSFLWRHVIPHLADRGRCIAPDLVGMGKSDPSPKGYRFVDHARFIEAFIDELGLTELTLVVHDWGSALGFDWSARHPDRVARLAFMEALILPLPGLEAFGSARPMFEALRTPQVGRKLIFEENVFIERILPGATVRRLSNEEMDAYRAPFLDPSRREPMWRWPNEIPVAGQPRDVYEIFTRYGAWLQESKIPKLLFHATPGALVSPRVLEWCRANLPSLSTIDLGAGIHFLPEDHPHEIGEHIAAWMRS